MCALGGGVLWALSPLGVSISETLFHTPNVFWKAFPSAPVLLTLGLVGLRLGASARSGLAEKVGFFAALLGLALVVAGAVGLYWLGLDDRFIVAAPSYRAFRLGLVSLAGGSALFGVGAARGGTLPVWGALPFAIGSLAGLISFSRDLDAFGAALWVAYGAGWAWLGLSVLVAGVAAFVAGRRSSPGKAASRK
jgi:hypothetical protein